MGAPVRDDLEHRALSPVRARAVRPSPTRVRFEIQLLHDVHHRLRPIEAARLGKSLEPYHLFWMEDPVPAELQEGFRTIRQHTTTPLAVGEVFDSIYDCYRLIQDSSSTISARASFMPAA